MSSHNHSRGNLTPARMEAFSDGVIAVIITIMVLDLRVPSQGTALSDGNALHMVVQRLLLYALSFVQVGIYWVNHHYLLDDASEVDHAILWLNLAFLFFLSLFPFATSWLGERGITSFSVALYSVCSFLPALSWTPISALLSRKSGRRTNSRAKEASSILLYLGAIGMAFWRPAVSIGMLITVAVMWILPPSRVLGQRS